MLGVIVFCTKFQTIYINCKLYGNVGNVDAKKTLRTSIPGFEVPVSRCEKIPGTTPLRSLTRYEHIIDLIAEYPILRQRYKAFKRGVQEAVEKGLEQGSDLSLVEHYELGRIFCY